MLELNKASIGMTVVKNESKTIAVFWKGMNFLFMILENHNPIDTANAPMNIPTTASLTPSQTAPPAATAAPAVQRGQ